MICPRCKGDQLDRSRTRSFPERAVRNLLRLRPYRCRGCARRFWAADSSNPRPLMKHKKRRIVVATTAALTAGAAGALAVIAMLR